MRDAILSSFFLKLDGAFSYSLHSSACRRQQMKGCDRER